MKRKYSLELEFCLVKAIIRFICDWFNEGLTVLYKTPETTIQSEIFRIDVKITLNQYFNFHFLTEFWNKPALNQIRMIEYSDLIVIVWLISLVSRFGFVVNSVEFKIQFVKSKINIHIRWQNLKILTKLLIHDIFEICGRMSHRKS